MYISIYIIKIIIEFMYKKPVITANSKKTLHIK